MRRALADAELEPRDIDYINAQPLERNGMIETKTLAIKEVFGQCAYQIPVVGNKAALGHSIAGSGALN